jgi:choline dehydrogenase-like flavoprotein
MNEDTFRAVIDRILPPDQDWGALAFGAERYLLQHFATHPDDEHLVREGLRRIDISFVDLSAEEQDRILTHRSKDPWFRRLAELVAEGVYADPGNGGNTGAASWRMVGYQPRLPDDPTGPAGLAGESPSPFSGTLDFDVIVVGAGAGGGVAARVLAEAGKHVLLIERGLWRNYQDSGHRDHLRNHRLSLYGHNTGPDLEGNPRVFLDDVGEEHIVRPHEDNYHNLAAAVGAGTLVYGAQAWRFHKQDFHMQSLYGQPEGSSLVDWPFGYEELEPWYQRAEWEIGVSGSGRSHTHEGTRVSDYPMPSFPDTPLTPFLLQGSQALGMSTTRVPLAINSRLRQGRPSCLQCGTCVGFICPNDAKNGTHNTVIPMALATGRCELLTGAMVLKVETNGGGKVTGVQLSDNGGVVRTVHAKIIVLAGGAIETPRLMLNSSTAQEPNGIGNNRDLVGRQLQGHVYPAVYATFDEIVHHSEGPGVTIATTQFSHGNPGVIGGGMLADDFVRPPAQFWKQFLPPDIPRWGQTAKNFMRDNFNKTVRVMGPVHEIPNPAARVSVSSRVTDRWGMPVPVLSGRVHTETLRTARFMFDRAQEWLLASGAKRIWGTPPGPHLSGGHHQAGTCRMGLDPETSVTDMYGRVWGHDNLFVLDGSTHPTNGGFNPVLTILALAFRNADHIARTV